MALKSSKDGHDSIQATSSNLAEKTELPSNDSWRCPNCLYSLRGLSGHRIICPECGEEHSAKQLDKHISEDADPSLDALMNSIALGGLFAIALFLSVVFRGYNPGTALWLSALGACGFVYACFKYNRLADGREGRWAFFLYTQLGVCLLLAVLTAGGLGIGWVSSTLSRQWGISRLWLLLFFVPATVIPGAVAFVRIFVWWLRRFQKFYDRS